MSQRPPGEQAALLAEIGRIKDELSRAHARIAELEALADVDPLLGILNRRGFERELARAIAYVGRYGAEAALVYIDLDNFKAANDRHGHAAGDALLKAIAAQLMRCVRASDTVGRLGGDELAVLLWNLSEAQAHAKALALEAVIADTGIRTGAGRVAAGASAGVTVLRAGESAATLIAAADAAMYVRKREKMTPR